MHLNAKHVESPHSSPSSWSSEQKVDVHVSNESDERDESMGSAGRFTQAVVLLDSLGNVLREFASQKLASEHLGVPQHIVSKILHGTIPPPPGARLHLKQHGPYSAMTSSVSASARDASPDNSSTELVRSDSHFSGKQRTTCTPVVVLDDSGKVRMN